MRTMTRTKISLLGALSALAFATAACGEDEQSGNAADAVSIDTFMYEPDPLEVDAGTTVTFTNEDDILHTVTEGTKAKPVKGGFDLQLDGAGTSGEVTFDEPGTIEYTCTIHDGMDGTAAVR